MTLTSNTRAQSTVLGGIFVFAIAIAALGLFQVFVVPQQNADVELSHAETVDSDFAQVHTAVMNAAQEGEDETVSVKLGTRYPSRALALNPPHVSGTIRTETLPSISGEIDPVTGQPLFWETTICGLPSDQDTRAFVHSANYNELQNIGVHGYENTVTYQDVDTDLASFKQDLIEGREITLRPLVKGEMSLSKISRESVTFKPGVTGGTTVETNQQWTLTLPTRLTVSQWQTILDDVSHASVSIGPTTNTVNIEFEPGTYKVRCTPLGIGERPSNNPLVVPGSSGANPGTINPRGPNELELRDVSVNGTGLDADYFNNHDGAPKVVTEVRVPYVVNPGQGSGDEVEFEPEGHPPNGGVTVTVGGGFEPVNSQSDWTWGPNTPQTVTISGSAINSPQTTGIAAVFKFADGSSSTYFIHPTN